MKLRNKKTGEIVEVESSRSTIGSIGLYYEGKDGWVGTDFFSLAELNEEWEDYTPTEPLIKDEKIRKAVRAWANSFDDVDEIKASDDYKEFWIDGYLIEFERSFNDVESEHTYRRTNITELCGEEEE